MDLKLYLLGKVRSCGGRSQELKYSFLEKLELPKKRSFFHVFGQNSSSQALPLALHIAGQDALISRNLKEPEKSDLKKCSV